MTLILLANLHDSPKRDELMVLHSSDVLDEDTVLHTYFLKIEAHLAYYQRYHLIVEEFKGCIYNYRLVEPYPFSI